MNMTTHIFLYLLNYIINKKNILYFKLNISVCFLERFMKCFNSVFFYVVGGNPRSVTSLSSYFPFQFHDINIYYFYSFQILFVFLAYKKKLSRVWSFHQKQGSIIYRALLYTITKKQHGHGNGNGDGDGE